MYGYQMIELVWCGFGDGCVEIFVCVVEQVLQVGCVLVLQCVMYVFGEVVEVGVVGYVQWQGCCVVIQCLDICYYLVGGIGLVVVGQDYIGVVGGQG